MGEETAPRPLFSNKWADAEGPRGAVPAWDRCSCFDQGAVQPDRTVQFHPERQDTEAPGWLHLLTLVEQAAADRRETFSPLVELSAEERRQIITLPASIATLTEVRHLVLYGSNLVRIPPEIGAMRSLENFSPYTSHRLHWFPYELTRCPDLARSAVSTRSLYGNYKMRPQFPQLPAEPVTAVVAGQAGFDDCDPGIWGATAIRTCSVCDQSIGPTGVRQVWISLRVATDVLPLLVNACSAACIQALPAPPPKYAQTSHTGGPGLAQPRADYE